MGFSRDDDDDVTVPKSDLDRALLATRDPGCMMALA